MRRHRFADWEFYEVGLIEPERNEFDVYLEILPQARFRDAATAKLHMYGAGPFCRFRIGRDRHEAGLYVLTLNENAVYAGECVNLSKRWGPNGYGGISPRNCFLGGQSTNCRINSNILSASKSGFRIELWFFPISENTEKRRAAETILIRNLKPAWNRAKMT